MIDFFNAVSAWFTAVWVDWHTLFRVVFIFIGAIIARIALQFAVNRVVNRVASGAKKRRDGADKARTELSPLTSERVEQRARTMGTVLGNLISWSIIPLAVIMVLGELGVAIGALATGAGLIGAAIGFGAQSLVRDLISGLFIVFEDQYGVGDNVDLGQASGVVESVGLRVTQVRDVEGTLWYVRNGEVLRVGNQSQGWSRVILDIALPYDTDIEQVEALALQAAERVAAKPEIKKGLIGKPEVWGIQLLSGDQVVIRLVQKVKPSSQEPTARALRAEIKKTMDAAKTALVSSNPNIYVSIEKARAK